ncbi:hypothetical protein E2976_02910 (plasmid) [Paracoccus yeei]|uniref:hypothetical protein n=1 Tax=Paracoccus yeei TaxID=147645 RepID=UPI003BF8B731
MTGDKHDLPDDLSLGQSLPARPQQDEEMNVPSYDDSCRLWTLDPHDPARSASADPTADHP